MQLAIHNYAEIVAAIVCTICFFYKPSFLNRWFMPFLWLTVVIELTGKELNNYLELRSEKTLMYNIFNGVEFTFYLWIFYRLNKGSENRRLLRLMIFVFLGFFVFNLFFIQGLWLYNNQTTTVGAILIITTCLYEYYRMYSGEDTYKHNKWAVICIATGLIIFYAGNFPNNALMTQMVKTDSKAARMLYATINSNLNVILYALFSAGFIIESVKRKNNFLALS